MRLGNRTIGVNLVLDFLIGGLWKPDFLLVGASFARDPASDVASKARSYRMSEVPNSKRTFGNEFATTNAYLLKLTPMVRLGNAPTVLGYISGVKNSSEKPKTK